MAKLLAKPAHVSQSHIGRVGFRAGSHLSTLVQIGQVALGAALLTAASWVRVPLFGAAVPLTLQPQMVLLLAGSLGARRATGAVVLWLGLAARGLPVLASGGGPAAVLGPSFGFVASYLLVAPLVGRFGRGRTLVDFACWLVACAMTLLGGLIGLRALLGSWLLAWQFGVAPFWLADVAKVTAAFVLHVSARTWATRLSLSGRWFASF